MANWLGTTDDPGLQPGTAVHIFSEIADVPKVGDAFALDGPDFAVGGGVVTSVDGQQMVVEIVPNGARFAFRRGKVDKRNVTTEPPGQDWIVVSVTPAEASTRDKWGDRGSARA